MSSSKIIDKTLSPFRITVIYVVVAMGWILLSDSLTHLITHDVELLVTIQNIKGIGFVLFTGAMLFGLIRKFGRRLEQKNIELSDAQSIAQLGSWKYSVDQERLSWSDQVFNIFDLPLKENPPSAGRVLSYFTEEDRDQFCEYYEQAILAGQSFEMDAKIRTVEDNVKYIRMSCRPDMGTSTDGMVLMGTILDVTKSKKQELRIRQNLKEKDVLIKEIHHRVKNNLAIIGGLLDLQADTLQDQQARMALEKSKNRVHSMAMVHELLYQEDQLSLINMSKYVSQIVESCNGAMPSSQQLSIHTEADEVTLTLDQAIPCGLILNELLDNAMMHAFQNGDSENRNIEPRINIVLSKEQSSIRLRVIDNGEGLAGDSALESDESLGLSLVQVLTKQLSGNFQIDNNPNRGVRAELHFPIKLGMSSERIPLN